MWNRYSRLQGWESLTLDFGIILKALRSPVIFILWSRHLIFKTVQGGTVPYRLLHSSHTKYVDRCSVMVELKFVASVILSKSAAHVSLCKVWQKWLIVREFYPSWWLASYSRLWNIIPEQKLDCRALENGTRPYILYVLGINYLTFALVLWLDLQSCGVDWLVDRYQHVADISDAVRWYSWHLHPVYGERKLEPRCALTDIVIGNEFAYFGITIGQLLCLYLFLSCCRKISSSQSKCTFGCGGRCWRAVLPTLLLTFEVSWRDIYLRLNWSKGWPRLETGYPLNAS